MKELSIVSANPLTRWTNEVARKATVKRLERAASALAEISVIWTDVDNTIVDEAERMIEDIRQAHLDWQVYWSEMGEGDNP